MVNKTSRIVFLSISLFVCALYTSAFYFYSVSIGYLVVSGICFLLLTYFIGKKGVLPLRAASARSRSETEVVTRLNNGAYQAFALVTLKPIGTDETLERSIKQIFSCKAVSIKRLKQSRISVTMISPKIGDERDFLDLFNKVLVTCSDEYEFGGCLYREPCQQLNVYQLAELSLAIAKTKQIAKGHVLKLNHTNLTLLQYSLPEMLKDILQRQFLLMFSPVFSVHGEALLFHQVEISVRHQKVGLCDAKQFFLGCLDDAKLRALDKHLLQQLIKTLLLEANNAPVLLCLDPCSWQSSAAIQTLLSLTVQAKLQHVIRFGIAEAELIKHVTKLKSQLIGVKSHEVDIVVTHCKGLLLHSDYTITQYVMGLYLDNELLNSYSESESNKLLKAFSKLACQHRVSLYCAGVNNAEQLSFLGNLGFEGASGCYFQQGANNLMLGLN